MTSPSRPHPPAPPAAGSGESAGWYPDPIGESELRYWTGETWTFRVARRRTLRAIAATSVSRARARARSAMADIGTTTGAWRSDLDEWRRRRDKVGR